MVASLISSFLSNSWLGKVLDGMSLSKYCLFLMFLEALFLVLSFSDYINDFPDDAVFNIDIYADTTFYSKMITFFLLRFTFVSVDLLYRLALNMTVISELMLLVALSTCWLRYRKSYVELMIQHLLPPLKPWLMTAVQPAYIRNIIIGK